METLKLNENQLNAQQTEPPKLIMFSHGSTGWTEDLKLDSSICQAYKEGVVGMGGDVRRKT